MNRFSYVRGKRSTALMMLLLWLFAVSSGVVNACALEPHGIAATVGHAETLVGHDGTLDASMAPCLKVCDDSSQALIKLKAFFELADRGPALTDSTLWAAAIQIVSAHRHRDSPQIATSEPTVRVRYSRLAL